MFVGTYAPYKPSFAHPMSSSGRTSGLIFTCVDAGGNQDGQDLRRFSSRTPVRNELTQWPGGAFLD